MDQIQALSKTAHRDLRVVRDKADAISAEQRMIPMVVSEFIKAAAAMPVLLTKNAANGRFLTVALCGFEDGENLFWREGRWDGLYVPLNVARHPFFLGAPEGDGDYVLCVDAKADCLSRRDGEALFDADGAETAYLRRTQAALRQLAVGERETLAFIDSLLEVGLLSDVALEITFANGEHCRMQGLYTIDEAKLDALPDAALLALRQKGYLPFIYAMIVSVAQIYALIERKNAALAKAQQWFAAGDAG